MPCQTATAAGTISIGGDLNANRIGYGTMQLTGPGEWGPPADTEAAARVLLRAVELGVNFIDTVDAYGPFVTDQLIHKMLSPYADDLIIATKVGQSRQGPGKWTALGRPEYLCRQIELSLRFLGLDNLDLLQLHRIDPNVPLLLSHAVAHESHHGQVCKQESATSSPRPWSPAQTQSRCSGRSGP